MVFVDASQEDAGTIRGMPHRNRAPLPRPVINALATILPYFGFLRVVDRPVGPAPHGWTDDEWRTLALLRRRHAAGSADAHEGPEDARRGGDHGRLGWPSTALRCAGATQSAGDDPERRTR